jgi:phosphoribosylformimino-5-aminoimidazole carboxamide ribonucleotide (ProFAR) isomerase
MGAFKRGRAASIIPEIQIRDAKIITGNAIEGEDSVRDISPAESLHKFIFEGAQMLQIGDVDAARSNPQNNEKLIKRLIDNGMGWDTHSPLALNNIPFSSGPEL